MTQSRIIKPDELNVKTFHQVMLNQYEIFLKLWGHENLNLLDIEKARRISGKKYLKPVFEKRPTL